VALQVRQAYLDYQNAVQQLQAARTRLKAARQARTATQERYNLGAASIVELRNANRDFVDAASQQVRARYNLLFQQKQIDYHVGRLDPRRPLRSVRTDR
jgi:outer membrane protein